MSNRALRITRIKKLFGASLSKERIGIYLKIDGKIPELFTPIGQDEVCPDGTVIKNDPIRLLPRIDNGESYLVRIPEGEHKGLPIRHVLCYTFAHEGYGSLSST